MMHQYNLPGRDTVIFTGRTTIKSIRACFTVPQRREKPPTGVCTMEGQTAKCDLEASLLNHWWTYPIEVSRTKIEGTVKHVEGPQCLSRRRWIIWWIQERSGMEFLEEVVSSAEKLRAPGF